MQVVLIDDIDGGPADETVTFGLDGVTYETDLSAEHAAQLRDALAGYIATARRAGGRASARRASGRGGRRRESQASDVRAWARANGYQVSERGRVSREVQEAYDRAHS
jgi:FMN phosphatase YigB (HAD superfamily)